MAKQKLTVEQMAQRALDYVEIQNVMSRHMYYHAAGKHHEELEDIWAKKHEITWSRGTGKPQVGKEVNEAYDFNHDKNLQKALENVIKVHPEVENKKDNWGIGTSSIHCQTTPVIEIAEDGETAQGIWYSPGMVTEIGEDGKPMGINMWEKYGIDFVKEDGEWKIWHLHLYGDVTYAPGKNWTEPRQPFGGPPGGEPGAKAGKPPAVTYGGEYSPTTVPVIMPPLPKPYKAFKDVTPF